MGTSHHVVLTPEDPTFQPAQVKVIRDTRVNCREIYSGMTRMEADPWLRKRVVEKRRILALEECERNKGWRRK